VSQYPSHPRPKQEHDPIRSAGVLVRPDQLVTRLPTARPSLGPGRRVGRHGGWHRRKTAGRLARERGRQPRQLASLQDVGGAILIGCGVRCVGGR
jgi:hypothetical protein